MTTPAPLGTGPLSLGAPLEVATIPTGTGSLSRWINPGSGDYEQDEATLQLKSMPPVRQRVVLIMRTLRGSSTVLPNLGVEKPDRMDETFERVMAQNVRDAYYQLTHVEKVIRIERVMVGRVSTGRADVLMAYTDLTTGEPDVVSTKD